MAFTSSFAAAQHAADNTANCETICSTIEAALADSKHPADFASFYSANQPPIIAAIETTQYSTYSTTKLPTFDFSFRSTFAATELPTQSTTYWTTVSGTEFATVD
jgi:hypothetical protein